MSALQYLCAMVILATAAIGQSIAPPHPGDLNIVPRWDRGRRGWDGMSYGPGGASVGRYQFGYSVDDFSFQAGVIRSVAFRRRFTQNSGTPAYTQTCVLEMSHSNADPARLSNWYANNVGRDPVVVFSGNVTFPAELAGSRADWTAIIPFQRPFVFDARRGRSVVVDLVRTSYVSSSRLEQWVVATAQHDGGNAFAPNPYMLGCWIRYQNAYNSSMVGSLHPGGFLATAWAGLPKNTVCFAGVGLASVGQMWHGHRLPIGLGDGCWWGVSSDFMLPFTTDAIGFGSVPKLPIPLDKRFVDLSIYTQVAAITNSYNSIGIVTTFVMEAVVGTGDVPNASSVVRDGSGLIYGDASHNMAPLMKIGWQ